MAETLLAWHRRLVAKKYDDVPVLANSRATRPPKVKSPRLGPGALLFIQQDYSAYRLTWTLVPPPGPPPMGPRAPLPLETTLTQSASLSLKYAVSLALRSASRLSCGAPEAAVVNPGSSKITQLPLSISVRVRDTDGLSVVTLISVPDRTLLAVWVYSLPLRLRTTGG